MKKLINQLDKILPEQLTGFIQAYPNCELNLDPCFVKRKAAPIAGQVALISGGGSGHEPMHIGFVGEGMLAGACPGEIFTSPTPDQMLSCAMAVDSGEGIVFLVKNYTGDILNFETATELYADMGGKISFIVVDDDVAVKDSLFTTGRRGVANTVLLEKMLGAAIMRGDSLDKIEALGVRLNNQGHSIGVALNACTVPAAGKPSFVLAENEMEFGVGIHGEPGIERRPYKNLDDTVEQMFSTLIENSHYHRILRQWDRNRKDWRETEQSKRPLQAGDEVIALVNNLGTIPTSELYGIYHKLAKCCSDFGIKIKRSLIGTYCSSLDMQGFSITLLQTNDEDLMLWDAPVDTPAMRWGK